MLYPPAVPDEHGLLERSHGQKIYWEALGNPRGEPIVMLHGGPGAGCSGTQRRFFDLNKYRVILWDQRGCARSAEHALGRQERETMLEHLSFENMVQDMEALRAHLKINAWSLFGGSWGTTLALAYAQAHPSRVKRMLLRGVFTSTSSEINWLYSPKGAAQMFPVEWQVFLAHYRALKNACGLSGTPSGAVADKFDAARDAEDLKWQDILGVFYQALRHGTPTVQERAALAWGLWEQSIMSLQGVPSLASMEHLRNFEMGLISCHLFLHDPVLNGTQLWDQMQRIAAIPCNIVQGQFDAVTPAQTAWKLSQVLQACQLQLVRQAGHASSDPELTRALVVVLDSWAF